LWTRDRQFPSTPAEELLADGSESDRNSLTLVILIHGYNNSVQRAHDSYERFRAVIRAVLPEGAEKRLGPTWELHWPGDLPQGALSLATYPVRVPVAKDVGRMLVDDFLAKLRPYQIVYIVAHSLGCRVALEAIARMRLLRRRREYSGPLVRAVFLLAAAVPVSRCTGAEARFSHPLPGSAEYVFHSRRDRALKLAFVAGQRGYGEHGSAVGRDGLPDGRWTDRMNTRLAHKDYWDSSDIVVRIAELLRLRHMRAIAERPLPADVLADDARLLEERHAAPRNLASRR
jgi:hypothetical protein